MARALWLGAILATVVGAWLALPQRPAQRPIGVGPLIAADEQCEVCVRRFLAKEAVCERLLAGELSLLQAAAWFRLLNNNPPEFPSDTSLLSPNDCEGEFYCRQVLAHALSLLRRNRLPESAIAETLLPLEMELTEMVALGQPDLPW